MMARTDVHFEAMLRHLDLIPLALRLIWDIDGVVDVVNRLGQTTEAKEAATA